MIHIRKFIDKMAAMESKQVKDVVIPMIDARGLRDDITRLLATLQEQGAEKKGDEVIKVEITGGSFK